MNQIGRLALLAGLCLPAISSAELIRFDNRSGKFVWSVSYTEYGQDIYTSSLDITLSPSQQYPENPNGIICWAVERDASRDSYAWRFLMNSQINVSAEPEARDVLIEGFDCGECMPSSVRLVKTIALGDLAGPDTFWKNGYYRYESRCDCQEPFLPMEGDVFLGVRFLLADGYHYGWIHTIDETPIEWAYETVPGKPAATCVMPADCTGDSKLDINDFVCFQSEWKQRSSYGDFDGSGTFTVNDFIAFQAAWRKGCE